MKQFVKRIEIAAILSFALIAVSFNFGNLVEAQGNERSRISSTPKPTPTPKVSTSPTPAFTPAPTPSPSSTPVSTGQTLGDLQAKIRSALLRPEIQRGQVGVKIVSLDTGKVVFEQNAEKYFMPASNMKSFTIAAALDKLTPDFRFVTSVYSNGGIDSSGTIHGDLTVYGRGDPSFSTAFTRLDTSPSASESDYLKGLDALATKIVQAGVKKVDGNFVADESYFNTEPIPAGWEWDDLQWYYGAEVSALTVVDNSLDLKITPGKIGEPCNISLSPSTKVFTILNKTQTLSAGTRRTIEVKKVLNSNVLEVRGTMPSDDKGFAGYIAATKPASLFADLLRTLLQQKGVIITGDTKTRNYQDQLDATRPPTARSLTVPDPKNSGPRVEFARIDSPPMSVVAAKTMKPSQNLYAELVLRALGEQVGDKSSGRTSEAKGIDAVQAFLGQAGVSPGSVVQYDGCGLSRHDLITPAAAVQLYTYMSQRPYAQIWRDSLPIGGVDGTLSGRFRGTAAANNVRAKTGTVDQVSALSGYVTTATGERLVFSVLTNGIPQSGARTATIDEIVVSLANFTGKTQ